MQTDSGEKGSNHDFNADVHQSAAIMTVPGAFGDWAAGRCDVDRSKGLEVRVMASASFQRHRNGFHPLLRVLQCTRYAEAVSLKEGPLFADCTEAVLGPNTQARKQLGYGIDFWLDSIEMGLGVAEGSGFQGIAVADVNNDGAANTLFRNDGGWRLTNVTKDVGLDENNRRFSFAAVWEDFDKDGLLDLYVANDYGRNNLYRNHGGRFVDAAAQAGVEDISSGMSVSWSDYNNDGFMDLYVANMFSAAGNRIAYQRSFLPHADKAMLSGVRRHARGNSLFRNNGDGTFSDVSEDEGVTMGRWAWASPMFDINNDGLEDIVIANGYASNEDSGDL